MPDDQDNEQTSDDASATDTTESNLQTSQDEVTDESTGQTTDDQSQSDVTTDDQSTNQQLASDQSQSDQTADAQSTGDASVKTADPNCAGWFADAESTSKRAAESYVRNELTGDRGVVENIGVQGRDNPQASTCV